MSSDDPAQCEHPFWKVGWADNPVRRICVCGEVLSDTPAQASDDPFEHALGGDVIVRGVAGGGPLDAGEVLATGSWFDTRSDAPAQASDDREELWRQWRLALEQARIWQQTAVELEARHAALCEAAQELVRTWKHDVYPDEMMNILAERVKALEAVLAKEADDDGG